MNSNSLFWLLATVLLTTAPVAEAQQTKKVYRIGYLSAASAEADKNRFAHFQRGMQELGYVEGKNIVIEQRYATGQFEKIPELAAELVGLKVDIIVTVGTPAAVAAKQTTSIIPIVMAVVADPVGEGLVASLARPGRNITGLANLDTELSQKRLEILKEVVPSLSRGAVLWNPGNPAHKRALEESKVAASALAVRLQSVDVRDPNEFKSAFSAMTREHAGALMLLADSMFTAHQARVMDFTTKSRLPSIYWNRGAVGGGGLMSYGASYSDLYRRAAVYVDKILKGTKPADLPVEQPMKFEFIVNLKTAKQIGLTIPPNVLVRADSVIR